MTANALNRGNLFPSSTQSESQAVKQGLQERKWTITEMEDIIRRERVVRQQAQLAAEQALTAAKEAQKMILQLEEELEKKDQQLQQEREARKQVEFVTQKMAKPAVHALVEADQSPEVEMEKDIQDKVPKSNATDQEETNSPKNKRPRDSTGAQSPMSKKHRGTDNVKEGATQGKGCRQKMSLAEARKAAQEAVIKRVQARANEIESKMKR